MGNVGEGAKGTTNGGAEVSETPEMAPEAVAGGRWMVRTQVLVDCMRVLHSVSGRECVQFDGDGMDGMGCYVSEGDRCSDGGGRCCVGGRVQQLGGLRVLLAILAVCSNSVLAMDEWRGL